MTLIKKFLILITILVFLIVLWRLIIIRITLRKEMEGFGIGSLFSSTESKEMTKVESDQPVNIRSSPASIRDLSLCELCVKASYNSALSGNYISLDMLQYVINRGCRYLDFEVLYVQDDPNGDTSVVQNIEKMGSNNKEKKGNLPYKAVVGHTTDPNYISITSENVVLLSRVLISAVSNAFVASCPNYQDPLFINLRIKSNNKNVYSEVASAIDSTKIHDKIYYDSTNPVFTNALNNEQIYPAKKVTRDTKLSNIMGCVVISVDKTINPNWRDISKCDSANGPCYHLNNYVNIQSGSEDMNLILYSLAAKRPQIQILNDNLHTTVETLTVANPDNVYLLNTSNPNPNYSDYILKYGCQWLPNRFYQNDSALENYEKFFNDHDSGFVPLSVAISYFMNRA